MNAQLLTTWHARAALGTLLGVAVAALALVGFDTSGRPADASFQPVPTSVAFVPLYSEPSAQAQRLGGDVASREPVPASDVADTDAAPPPAPAEAQVLAQNESCTFPCVPDLPTEAEPQLGAPEQSVSEDGERPEVPSDAESSEDIVETE